MPLLAAGPVHRDLEYAPVDGYSLTLDLYLPETAKPPLLVWVHGEAWRSGSASADQSIPRTGRRLRSSGIPDHVVFEVIHGGAHRGEAFYDKKRIALIAAFLRETLAAPQVIVTAPETPCRVAQRPLAPAPSGPRP